MSLWVPQFSPLLSMSLRHHNSKKIVSSIIILLLVRRFLNKNKKKDLDGHYEGRTRDLGVVSEKIPISTTL